MGAFAHSLMAFGLGPEEDILNGVTLSYNDLGSFVLGELYRVMFLLSTDPKQSHGRPMWLMQMWAYSYFPSITPELHPTIVPWPYGKA